jgi:hypothetical protein
VAVALGAVTAGEDVVLGPPRPELGPCNRQLADEGLQLGVVWVAAGVTAQDRDVLAGDDRPVDVQVARGRVEEDPTGVVAVADRPMSKSASIARAMRFVARMSGGGRSRLRTAGVAVTTVRSDGITHDFMSSTRSARRARRAPRWRRPSPSCARPSTPPDRTPWQSSLRRRVTAALATARNRR